MIRVIKQPEIGKTQRYGFYIFRQIDALALNKDDPRRRIAHDNLITEYLHVDGQWRISTISNGGQYTGYYNTKEQAEKLMESY